jgi:AraC-like DNA-binding protein
MAHSSIAPDFLDQVDNFIQINLSNGNLCLDDLKDALFLSTSQIYRKIKEKTGKSPSVYIRNYRLAEAYHLITSTEDTFSQIAYEVGFSSLSYFSRCFTEYYGYSPSSLRKETLDFS